MCWAGVIVKLDWLDFSNPLPDIHLGHTDAVVVLTTLATTDEAAKFVRALLDRRLVACGTILPGTRSLYRWEDKLADETEVDLDLRGDDFPVQLSPKGRTTEAILNLAVSLALDGQMLDRPHLIGDDR